jgi:hypothetical protein
MARYVPSTVRHRSPPEAIELPDDEEINVINMPVTKLAESDSQIGFIGRGLMGSRLEYSGLES